MPSLILFKRRWLAGSDDLVLPGILLSLLHFILFLLTSIFVISSSDLEYWSSFDPDVIAAGNANETSVNLARCANDLRFFTLFFVALLILATLIEAIMTWFSMRGTVLDPEPRKPVRFILYVRFVLGVVEVIFSIVAAEHLRTFWNICNLLHHLLAIEAVIIAINFLLLLNVLITLPCIFDSSGKTFYRLQKAKDNPATSLHLEEILVELDEKAAKSWRKSLRRCFCCIRDTSNTNIALDEASHLLRDLFSRVDLVPSDILVGLILLRHKQQCAQLKKVSKDKEIQEFYCGRPVTKDMKYIDPQDPSLEELIYYCNYSVATYGSPLYLFYHPFTGLCSVFGHCLCKYRFCCGGRGAHVPSTFVEKDPCCGWETSATIDSLNEKLKNIEIVYASWRNNVYEQPFFVTVDHERRAIVVAVRGTLSELDALTDIVATPEVIPVPGNNGSWKCHKGMLKGALLLYDRLVKDEVLAAAFGHNLEQETDKYKLVLVGHSLGAGVAAVLSILLRPIYPHVRCFAYSPPGGLFTQSAVDLSRDFITTVAFGKDVVIRASIQQLDRMKRDILELLKKSNFPKYKILFGNRPFPPDVDLSCESSAAFDGPSSSDVSMGSIKHDALYPPGKIFHIVYPSRPPSWLCRSRNDLPHYAIEGDNFKDFNEILVSNHMLLHHWPQKILKALKKVQATSLPEGCTKKYEDSATIPSHARLPTNQKREENIQNPTIDQPHLVVEVNAQSCYGSDVSRVQERTEAGACAPLMADTNPLLSSTDENLAAIHDSTLRSSNSLQSAVDSMSNASQRNSSNPVLSTEVHKAAGPGSSNDHSGPEPDPSMVGRFKTYMDAVLPEAPSVSSDHHLGQDFESSKLRSQSMPPHASIDRNTIERAQFEPNLIPKPPRSNSMVRQRPTDLKVSLDRSKSPSLTSRDDGVIPSNDAASTS